MNILEKHNFVKKFVSAAAMSFALLGGTYLVNNQTAQTVQAARRVVNVQTPGAIIHYIKLANKPGTHYFNKQLEMIDWAVDSPTYNMHGEKPDYSITFGGDDIVGTKTINGVHYFIANNYPGHYLEVAHDYYAPVSYQINKGQTVQTYNRGEARTENGDPVYLNSVGKNLKFGNGKYFMVLNKRGTGNRLKIQGEWYLATADQHGYFRYIKQSDLRKMHRAAHQYDVNSARFNKYGRFVGHIYDLYDSYN